jgi:hypothetical protein
MSKQYVSFFLQFQDQQFKPFQAKIIHRLIRGGPIFSVSNGGDGDHGMNTAEIT